MIILAGSHLAGGGRKADFLSSIVLPQPMHFQPKRTEVFHPHCTIHLRELMHFQDFEKTIFYTVLPEKISYL